MDLLEHFQQFFDDVYEFIFEGIYDFVMGAIIWLIARIFILYIDANIWMIGFAWSIAQEIIEGLSFSDFLNSSLDALPLATKQALVFFKIPEALNMLASALATRIVLKFMPI